MPPSPPQIASRQSELLDWLGGCGAVAVAFSGGVDSGVVAKGAQLALGEKAIAITGNSASLARDELEQAKSLARQIAIRHVVIDTDEVANAAYAQNAPDRCYHCKTELYSKILACRDELGFAVLLNGANADDLGDYRPGMTAAAEQSVRSPLAECGIGKQEVRQLAAAWGLPVWDKPASPCLSSRIAYGEEVTPERLAMVEGAEKHRDCSHAA